MNKYILTLIVNSTVLVAAAISAMAQGASAFTYNGRLLDNGVPARAHSAAPADGFAWYRGGTHSDSVGDPGAGGSVLMTLKSTGCKSTGAWLASARTTIFPTRALRPTLLTESGAGESPYFAWRQL
jgi:hypothetical protein